MAASVYIWLFVTMTTLFSLAAGDPTPAKCTQEGACKCTFNNGGIIDLSKISGLEDNDLPWKKDIEPTGSSTEYVYSYKPCFDFNEDGTVGGNCNNVASCQKAKGKTDQYSLGMSASAKFMDENGEIKLKYAADPDMSSTIRETWVTLKCADGEGFEVKGEITGTNAGTSKYVYILSTPHACWQGGAPGSGIISVGTILCIVLLVVIVFYIVGGVLYMTFKVGAEGAERIPNWTFWKDFPLMIKDGACFAISPITKKNEYSKM
ncbi:uncharacterized protein LOC135500489 [Lineus longissimus]|uniref:uncharacterized protein LOC135500489 n=1 Tax=Lineus longissimus TaxID=88925 RepID=UPI002B4CBEB5